MKKLMNSCFYLVLVIMSLPCWAALPKPPTGDMADGSKNWVETGKTMLYKGIGYAAVAGGAIVIIGVAYSIFSAYHVAQEKQDLGHFFKHLMVGLLVAAITSALIYVGYSTVTG